MLLVEYSVSYFLFAVLYIFLRVKSVNYTEEVTPKKSILRNRDFLSILKAIPLLIALFFSFFIQSETSTIFPGIFFALSFCLIADFFIDRNLIQGMLFFAMAQLFLLISFLYEISLHLVNLAVEGFLLMLVITILIYVYTYTFLRYLSTLKIEEKYTFPITFYSLLISTMLASSIWLAYIIKIGELVTLPLGALMFMVSDSLIAMREFNKRDMTYSVQKIMGLYYGAIFLISLSTMWL